MSASWRWAGSAAHGARAAGGLLLTSPAAGLPPPAAARGAHAQPRRAAVVLPPAPQHGALLPWRALHRAAAQGHPGGHLPVHLCHLLHPGEKKGGHNDRQQAMDAATSPPGRIAPENIGANAMPPTHWNGSTASEPTGTLLQALIQASLPPPLRQVLKEKLRWIDGIAFALIFSGAERGIGGRGMGQGSCLPPSPVCCRQFSPVRCAAASQPVVMLACPPALPCRRRGQPGQARQQGRGGARP